MAWTRTRSVYLAGEGIAASIGRGGMKYTLELDLDGVGMRSYVYQQPEPQFDDRMYGLYPTTPSAGADLVSGLQAIIDGLKAEFAITPDRTEINEAVARHRSIESKLSQLVRQMDEMAPAMAEQVAAVIAKRVVASKTRAKA